jgi:DNA repair photolyase
VNRPQDQNVTGRGAQCRPPNRFAQQHVESDLEQWDPDEPLPAVPTQYLPDQSQSVVSENESPDVGFRYSINPYRGCSHGCSYCYARPTHEYLGLDAGLDFETKILVKHRAPELFRNWLAREAWRPEPIIFSGVTDCYQPAERDFQLTRQCLEVALEARQPVSVITKNALVTRDLELLRAMAERRLVQVAVSITSLDQALTRVMEPRTSCPAARLSAIKRLSEAGVPTQVMIAPVIPSLNDHEIPAILQQAHDHGAKAAGWVLLRLPLTVRPVFLDWLVKQRPAQADRVMASIREVRGGRWNDAQFGLRHRGAGPRAEQIRALFQLFAQRLQLDRSLPALNVADFQRPVPASGQRWLF